MRARQEANTEGVFVALVIGMSNASGWVLAPDAPLAIARLTHSDIAYSELVSRASARLDGPRRSALAIRLHRLGVMAAWKSATTAA